MLTRDPHRAAATSATLMCALFAACSAPPAPEPVAPPPPASATTPAYDVDAEGRFPPPPVVAVEAAHGWRDTLWSAPVAPSRHAAGRDSVIEPSQATGIRPGFRIQIAACANLESAQELQRELRAQADWPVYVEHEPPYYKVRVGDCSTEDECRALESRLRADGWQSAWLVRTPIVSH